MNTSRSTLLLALVAGSAALAQGQTLLYEFTFDDYANGTTAVSTGQPSRTANLIHHPSAGVTNPTNLRGTPGSGVSGSLGDYALDLSDASKMGGTSGSPGYGGSAYVTGGASALSNATSFTIAGWYNANTTPGNFARLVELRYTSLYFSANGTLQVTAELQGYGGNLSTSDTRITVSDPIFTLTSQWVFFAFTFDSVSGEANLYAGTSPDNLATIVSGSFAKVPVTGISGDLSIGNSATSSHERPFDGLIDNIRIWADTSGSASALSEEALKSVMRNDLGLIPEPSSAAVLAGVATLGLAASRRRRAK